MKKSILFLAIVFCFLLSDFKVCAQLFSSYDASPMIVKDEPGSSTYGINMKMQYQAIINTNVNQQQLIKNTKDFLFSSGLLDSNHARYLEISNTQSEFTIPFGFRQGEFCGKGKTFISKRLKNPAILFFNATFTFSESGTVRITFSDFREKVVAFIDNNSYGYSYFEHKAVVEKGSAWSNTASGSVPESDPNVLLMKQVMEIQDKVYQAGTITGKIGTTLNALEGTHNLLDGSIKRDIQRGFQELKADLDKEYALYKTAINRGLATWADSTNLAELYLPNEKKSASLASERIAKGFLVVVDNERWNKYFEKIFNSVFLEIAALNGGTIKGIRKDNEPAYDLIDGDLKPVKNKK